MDSSSGLHELISSKLVKPFSPTPSPLRTYTISLIDQLYHKKYIPVAFFYPKPQDVDLLEKSLSKTLSYYYPFAGRLIDNISVNCNDTGVTFNEVRIRASMSDILDGPDQDIIFPSGLPWEFADDQPSLTIVQLSHFDCGGTAISVCLRHNIADAHTLCNFINDWAAIARNSSEIPSPQFIGASVLPPIDDPSIKARREIKGKNCVARRYIFDSKNLNDLMARATNTNTNTDDDDQLQTQKPSRVDVLSALLYKCAMSASKVCYEVFKPSLFISLLNMRPLIGPPATQHYAGNLVSCFVAVTIDEKEIDFSRLVTEIRKQKMKQFDIYKGMTPTALIADSLHKLEQGKKLEAGNYFPMDEYVFTSWCKLSTGNLDFGCGTPIRMRLAPMPVNNSFILTDIPNGDGIEATVTLEEEVMSVFQNDPEILTFASTSTSYKI